MNAPLPRDPPRRIRFGVDDYLRLDETGVLQAVGRTELIDGDIIVMHAMHRPHSWTMFRLARLMEDALAAIGSPLGVLIEATVAMPPDDAPQPDIVVTSEPRGSGVVPLATVALLVEIADSTVGFDLRDMAALYSRMGVPEYWVVDLGGGRVEQMVDPAEGGYRSRRSHRIGSPIAAAAIAGLTVATAELVAAPR